MIGAQVQNLLICRRLVPGSCLRHVGERKEYHRLRRCAFEYRHLAALHDELPERIQGGLYLVQVVQDLTVHTPGWRRWLIRYAVILKPPVCGGVLCTDVALCRVRLFQRLSLVGNYPRSTLTAATSIVIGAKRWFATPLASCPSLRLAQ